MKTELFEVNPFRIKRSCFENPRTDQQQERTRQIIQDAFAEVDKYPEKYASSFYTLIPEKNWNGYKTVEELKVYANDLGGHMGDWVEQALEWAQRIFNGESWEKLCNNEDTANWPRLIMWANDTARPVGSSRNFRYKYPTTYVHAIFYAPSRRVCKLVPLVVCRKK